VPPPATAPQHARSPSTEHSANRLKPERLALNIATPARWLSSSGSPPRRSSRITVAGLQAPRPLGVGAPRAVSALAIPLSVATPAARTFGDHRKEVRRPRYDVANGVIQLSTDGDSAPEMEIELTGAPALFVSPGFLGSDIIL
jgi:hypothetical protein